MFLNNFHCILLNNTLNNNNTTIKSISVGLFILVLFAILIHWLNGAQVLILNRSFNFRINV